MNIRLVEVMLGLILIRGLLYAAQLEYKYDHRSVTTTPTI